MSLDPCPSDDEIRRIALERLGRRGQGSIMLPAAPLSAPLQPVEVAPAVLVAPTPDRGAARQPGRAARTQTPTEHQEQRALFRWIDAGVQDRTLPPEFGRIYAIPNGGYRAPATAGRMRAEGVRPGYPDIGWDLPRRGWTGFRGELKREGKASVSPEQLEWHTWLERCGLYVVTAVGCDAMRTQLLHYYDLGESTR